MIRYIVFALLGPIAVFVLVATYWRYFTSD